MSAASVQLKKPPSAWLRATGALDLLLLPPGAGMRLGESQDQEPRPCPWWDGGGSL